MSLTPPLRLIPDVNVLLSALHSTGGSAHALFQAARRFEIVFVLCEEHFLELRRVLTYKRVLNLLAERMDPSVAFRLATELHRMAEYHERLEHYDWPSCRDPKDWYLLDLLVTAQADGIITRDKVLLETGEKLELPIHDPLRWLSEFRSRL